MWCSDAGLGPADLPISEHGRDYIYAPHALVPSFQLSAHLLDFAFMHS